MHESPTLLVFTALEARTAEAIFARMFPATSDEPSVAEIGVISYVDRALSDAYADSTELYRQGLAALDRVAEQQHKASFANCTPAQQDALISELEQSKLSNIDAAAQKRFFDLLLAHLQEGLFADPAYGGNRNKLGWKWLGHPGVWLENSAEENLATEPVTKGGIIQSLADLGYSLEKPLIEPSDIPGFDPRHSVEPPTGSADVVLVGVGAIGGIIAPLLAKAGLRVVGLEAGIWRSRESFTPDELGATYYCRANMGPKFLSEVPRWRRSQEEPTQEATFSLGRMMNAVGGSVIHYGAWLRRYHPHHFRPLSTWREADVEHLLPEHNTLVDWPITYEELEPYYTQVEYTVGVAGTDENSFAPRGRAYPMPPLRPFRLGEVFRATTTAMGLHPYPVAVGVNSVPYDGRPATQYTAWSNGFGSYTDDKWYPALSSIPEALATGNFDLRTGCTVLRICTDSDGHASGVEYIDANGNRHVQEARTVILSSYTFENVRLLLLSGDNHHPNGLGNNFNQVGKNFMTKMFAHVNGHFPHIVFNRHTGPAAQGMVLDDFLATSYNGTQHSFLGGATLGAENQLLPIQISRECLPSTVRRWGESYKQHIRQWQHLGVIRIQPDTLPYQTNYLDLDPHFRDRNALGRPAVRITYDLQANEHRLANWMEGKAEEILQAMGASSTWRGPRFTGVGSSHDLGGCRMGHEPTTSVVNADLAVHDTPGLYVFSGAVCPTCPGINPTLTLWALCVRAAERLVARLRSGEEL